VAAVLAMACVSGGVGYAVAQSSGERLAGDEATGDLPEGSVDRISKANGLAADGKILDAVKVYDDLLADDPENPVALAERGWLVSRVDPSLVDGGLANVEKAIAIDPADADAHFFRGMILWKAKDDPVAGAGSLQRALELNPPPDFRGLMQQQLDGAKAAAAERASATP
jgi:tetratricopeptide (TPR) repeat protein